MLGMNKMEDLKLRVGCKLGGERFIDSDFNLEWP